MTTSGALRREPCGRREELADARCAGAVGFMINCSHPAYFEGALVEGDWLDRLPALTLWGGCWAAAVGRTTGTSARSARNASLLIPA
jgi:hypothetical protein